MKLHKTVSKKNFKLKSWVAKKKGMKKAIVAVARKLAAQDVGQ
ncbi:hypothetical protein [Candidatus Wolbachia massiliensis]|nr:hypothetical protein [Candidatus Wolbachia massiliensis]